MRKKKKQSAVARRKTNFVHRNQGQSERVLSRMKKLTQMASKVEPPRVVRHSNKKPRRVRRRY